MSGFKGKVALVTGAGSGIGRATATVFASRGARVVVADVNADGGEETTGMIVAAGGEATFIKADISKTEEVAAMVDKVLAIYGSLDCAVNNAGVEGVTATTADYPEEVWNNVIAINLTGVWLCLKKEIQVMLAAGGGSIVNMASILGLAGFANATAYTAAKHGVVGITQVAALEYATQGIRVNAVCPGFIETPMLMDRSLKARENPEVYNMIAGLEPVKRLGQPEEVANAIIWLSSDEASFVTGEAMIVDGGYLAQ